MVGVQGVTNIAHGGVWVQSHGKYLQQAHGVQLRRVTEAIIHVEIIYKS